MEAKIIERLFELRDGKYRDFTASLIPNIDKDRIIGVRTPILRKYAKELIKGEGREVILSSLPHRYLEVDSLHVFFINEIKDFDTCLFELERFLPYVDNWATCDGIRPRSFLKNTDRLIPHIEGWLKSEHTYTVRFAIEMLMVYYLDENFEPRFVDMVAGVESDEYYVNMMIAWYFATALAKRWDETVGVIDTERLSPWVHNKTIQKARDSYRIADVKKEYLKAKRR
ncbi:MAG: DNA alkylation repair protein [Ruminococcaceae bacterium]|nr:DNA alkylation repair protein [Oscillospiraceae bacterium]